MDSLVDSHEMVQHMQENLMSVIEWNCMKHIATSERVEHPKDQSTTEMKAFRFSMNFAATLSLGLNPA